MTHACFGLHNVTCGKETCHHSGAVVASMGTVD
jgi:hypothetical protein